MKCPACGYEQPDGQEACEKCQVIFSKWLERKNRPVAGQAPLPPKENNVNPSFSSGKKKSILAWIIAGTVLLCVVVLHAYNKLEAEVKRRNAVEKQIENGRNIVASERIKKSASAGKAEAGGSSVSSEKIALISNSEEVDLNKHLEPGKIVIFDFYADWCGPCVALAPKLDELAATSPDIIIRKINIKSWGTPVTKQYGINFVPNIRVYNKQGKMVGEPTSSINAIKQYVETSK